MEASTKLDPSGSAAVERGEGLLVEHPTDALSMERRSHKQEQEIPLQRSRSLTDLRGKKPDDLVSPKRHQMISWLIDRIGNRDRLKGLVAKGPCMAQRLLPESIDLPGISMWVVNAKGNYGFPL